MSFVDWLILFATLAFVIWYGIKKGKGEKNLHSFFKSNNNLSWFIVLLSIMGTQASAVTFLSGPGQAYTDGMRFVQYYFGLPLAMVVLSITFIPIFHKLKVYTAYEFLEHRFDLKTRTLAALLFLLQRGLSTGISIYAPSIIISSLLGWNIYLTNMLVGGLLIIYTTTGGARAVAYTQVQQLIFILVGMFFATYLMIQLLPEHLSFTNAVHIADKMDKLNFLVTDFHPTSSAWWQDKYNVWSGIIGGFFLALSYFGTDQSQVSRYLTSKNVKESQKSVLMNGFVKVPMQFGILFVGAILFVFYLNFESPINFNSSLVEKTLQTSNSKQLEQYIADYNAVQSEQKTVVKKWSYALDNADESAMFEKKLKSLNKTSQQIKVKTNELIKASVPLADTNDTNYIFLYFILHQLPKGIVGLLIAMLLLASWGSISAAVNSLSTSSIIDIYKRYEKKEKSELHYFRISKIVTVFWGISCVGMAMFASKLGSLIEAVNVLGSLFYGVMLGIFLTAFYLKTIKSNAVFYSSIIVEIGIVIIYFSNIVSFLWLNVIGCLGVMLLAYIFHTFRFISFKKRCCQ